MAMLTLRLLGRFQLVDADGTLLHVPAGKPRALLAALVWRPGKARTRSKLATLLWGDRPEELARHSLSQALTSLRQTVGDDLVRSDGEQLYIDPERVEVDVVRLRSLTREGTREALEEAGALCTAGEFLEELEANVPDFEDWLQQARAEIEEIRDTVYEELLKNALASGETRRASEVARTLLARDPLNERAHRGLMRAFVAQGHPERSLRQYETCRARLGTELAIEPADETQALAEAVRAGDISGAFVDAPAPSDGAAAPPVVAVLPFATIENGEPAQHIANGMTHDLITELSRFRSIQVIAKDTAFRLRSGFDAAQAAREVGASYVLTGSLDLQSENGGVRINARLIDAHTGVHVWSERYDVGLDEFFEVRDDIVASIAGTAAPLVERERMRMASRKPTTSWNAYDHYLRAFDLYFAHWSSPIPPPACKPLLERAVQLDPEFARGYALLACVTANMDTEESVDEDFSIAVGHGRTAMMLDPRDAHAPRVLGVIYTLVGRYEEAQHHLWHALRLNPNDADLAAHEARFFALAGTPEHAFVPFERARRLNPLHPGWYWSIAATAHHLRGEYSEAVAALERMDAKTFIDHLYLAACRAELGDIEEAQRAMKRGLADQPGLTLRNVVRYLPYRDEGDRAHVLRGLAKAGMPDGAGKFRAH